jgi:hypothetical protein
MTADEAIAQFTVVTGRTITLGQEIMNSFVDRCISGWYL